MSQPTFACGFVCYRCEDREATLDEETRKCLTALRERVDDLSSSKARGIHEILRLRREIARLKGRRC